MAAPSSARSERRSGPPPWILGARGAALEAPENTFPSLRRALELGADGVAYDLRACASGELVLLADPTLERTSDAHGRIADRSWQELSAVDAGGWFHRRFVGEPLPLLEEVLELEGDPGQARPMHAISLHEPAAAGELARVLKSVGQRLAVRVGVERRSAALELRDLGLVPMLRAEAPDEDLRRFVRDERLEAVALPAGGWRGAGEGDWSCERWELGVDAPADLLAACRRPLFGLTTHEPARARAVRELVALVPEYGGAYPLEVPELAVAGGAEGEGGEWAGRWRPTLRVRNPLPFPVRVAVQVFVRRGAFEVRGLPVRLSLLPGSRAEVPFEIAGGSWSPGGDPLCAALFRWERGPGRPAGRLLLDAPLVRRRATVADVIPRRLTMLREGPRDPAASMTLRRQGRELLIAIENAGGLADAQAVCVLEGRPYRGGRGLRAPLPADFDARPEGVAFACGMLGRRADAASGAVLRRWSGGLPQIPDSGAPGRLLPLGVA